MLKIAFSALKVCHEIGIIGIKTHNNNKLSNMQTLSKKEEMQNNILKRIHN